MRGFLVANHRTVKAKVLEESAIVFVPIKNSTKCPWTWGLAGGYLL